MITSGGRSPLCGEDRVTFSLAYSERCQRNTQPGLGDPRLPLGRHRSGGGSGDPRSSRGCAKGTAPFPESRGGEPAAPGRRFTGAGGGRCPTPGSSTKSLRLLRAAHPGARLGGRRRTKVSCHQRSGEARRGAHPAPTPRRRRPRSLSAAAEPVGGAGPPIQAGSGHRRHSGGSPPPALLPSSLSPSAHLAPARLAGRWGCSSSSPAWLRACCSVRRGAHGRARRRPALGGGRRGEAGLGRAARRGGGLAGGGEAAEPEGRRAGRAPPGSAGDRRGASGGRIAGGGGAEGRRPRRPAAQWRAPRAAPAGGAGRAPPGAGRAAESRSTLGGRLRTAASAPQSRPAGPGVCGWAPPGGVGTATLLHLVTC